MGPQFFIFFGIIIFCELGAHAKIWIPMTTPYGIIVCGESGIIPKIVAYLSCSAGRKHFAQTNKNQHWVWKGPKSDLMILEQLLISRYNSSIIGRFKRITSENLDKFWRAVRISEARVAVALDCTVYVIIKPPADTGTR